MSEHPEMHMKPRLNETFDWEPMPDGCILFSQETGQVLTVNPTAELILTFCDGENSLETIYEDVSKDIDIPRDAFLETVERFVKEEVLLKDDAPVSA